MTTIYENSGVFGDENQFTNSSNRLNKIIDALKNLPASPKRVLDIGCGTGFLTNEIKKMYPSAKVIGADVSKTALTIARNQYPQTNFIEVDAEKYLPFETESFDLIFSGEHIEHLKDVDMYLEELHRTAAPNATLILTTPNLTSWLNRILMLFGRQPLWLEPSLRKLLPIVNVCGLTFPQNLAEAPSGHLRLYTLNMLKKMLALYGFETSKAMGCTLLTKPILKQIDQVLSSFPSLGIGIIIVAQKPS